MKHFLPFLCFDAGWLFRSGFALGFSSSRSATSSASSTSNQVTDQRVAASEGSVSAGSGATVNIDNSDTEAISRLAEIHDITLNEGLSNSLKAAQNLGVAGIEGAVDASKYAVGSNANIAEYAIGAGVEQTGDALDFGERALLIATTAANQSQAQSNDLIQRTNEQFTAKLASNAGDAPQAVAQDAIKYGALALVAIGALFVFLKPSTAK